VILALGGHEFSRRRGNEAIVEYMLALLAPERPRICLLPTASGDATDQIHAFRNSLGERDCELSHLSLFRLEQAPVTVRELLLSQDLIYVGGGSMVNLLAIWRAHGIDEILVEAWRRGIVLCGQSAGAMCWFRSGISRSGGSAATVAGLGVIEGTLSVHYHRDPERREALRRRIGAAGGVGYGVDDHAGLLIRGKTIAAAISAAEGAGVWQLERDDASGELIEASVRAEPLPSPRPAIDAPAGDVSERRRVLASRTGGSGASAAVWSRRKPGS